MVMVMMMARDPSMKCRQRDTDTHTNTHKHTHTQETMDDKAHVAFQIWLELQTSLVNSVDLLAALRILIHTEADNRRTKTGEQGASMLFTLKPQWKI